MNLLTRHKRARRQAIVFLALGFLLASAAGAAAQAAVVRPEPGAVTLEPGTEARVDLLFEGVQDLYGLEVHLSFDPSLVEVLDADADAPGVQLAAADWLAGAFVAVNQADNAAGRIDFAATLLNPAEPVSGDHVFATFTLRARGAGSGVLHIEEAILATRDGVVIASSWRDGKLDVGAAGQEGAVGQGEEEPASSTGLLQNTRLLVILAAGAVVGFVLAVGILLIVVLFRRR
jgi:hypothetical protein